MSTCEELLVISPKLELQKTLDRRYVLGYVCTFKIFFTKRARTITILTTTWLTLGYHSELGHHFLIPTEKRCKNESFLPPPGPTTMYNMIPYSLHPPRFTRPHGKIYSSNIAQAITPHTAPAVTTALSKMLTKTRQPEALCHLPSSTVACTYNNSNDTIVELFNCLLLAVACRGFVPNALSSKHSDKAMLLYIA